MSEKKNTCPVCFTKMHTQNDVLVCPECGYKLCDHSYAYHNSYSTEHTHTPNYTTSYKTNTSAPTGTSGSGNYTPQRINTAQANPRVNSGSGTNNKMSRGGKIVLIFVILYVIIQICSVFFAVFAQMLS